jgi:RNA polymerase sigma-70 factor (ECF subfamily)
VESREPTLEPFQQEAAAFLTTRWSVVLKAQGRTPAAERALNGLCRSYWLPLSAFVRRDRRSAQEAQDLTQESFLRFLELPHPIAVLRT